MSTLWHNLRLINQPDVDAIVSDGASIVWVGEQTAAPDCDQTVDLGNAWVTPGFIDCHTHVVFGGERAHEFDLRLQGKSYAEIAASGGGIASTMQATRQSDEQTLYKLARRRIEQLIADGVTTIEIKSGYGLDELSETKMLRVIRQLGEDLPVTILSTALLAHSLPPEYADDQAGYVHWVCQMLPKLHKEGLIDAVDAFCEHLAFSPEQVAQIFDCAGRLYLPVKLHAEQLSLQGGAQVAARFHALSADHLEYLDEAGVIAMAKAGTVAVLLPGAFYFLRETQYPPVNLLRRYQVPIAIASDCNPGTSPVLSLRLMMNMACTLFRLTPSEALAGVTTNAAKALGLQNTHGQIAPGFCADMIAWQVDDPAEICYWLGGQLPHQRIYQGELDASQGV
ncbi:imidazolonepropionase [Celerinatantimonas diazotrophica]|uniref:Imidazolonepropionase n=1 Tax=Celerinatantimonas diazotrophica TaxID=412034 RepID=A0A4R1J927_9GAMM|nr:imidazolonepropionase [Celerinatantimonas diazotrophica]CAG9295861.1 Imidazolonepropionase [Celerinatantimonas diazotrophica]